MLPLTLRITDIRIETTDCRTYLFDLPGGEKFEYKAGQFITLIIHLNHKEERRSYSLSSTPDVDEHLSFTVKRVTNGEISRHLFDHLKPGDTINALSPSGRFVIEQSAKQSFFIAAGSGITPVFSLIKQLLFHQHPNVTLVYQNPNERHSIFRKQLLELQMLYAQSFHLIELFSDPSTTATHPQRLNNWLLERLILQHVNTSSVLFYVCGPKAFMLMAQFTLRVMGYEEAQIKKENFVIDHIPPPPFISDMSPHKVVINFNGQIHRLLVAYPHNILEIALKNNIQLPYSCRGGKCSTCMATCTQGRVKMSMNEVLTEKDLEKGLVLTCVGYPETDVELVFE